MSTLRLLRMPLRGHNANQQAHLVGESRRQVWNTQVPLFSERRSIITSGTPSSRQAHPVWIGKKSTMGVTSIRECAWSSTPSHKGEVRVSPDEERECLRVIWGDGTEEEEGLYPYLWLRDNCQCARCYNASSMSRRLLMRDLDPNTTPMNVEVVASSEEVRVRWMDGHESTYGWAWLRRRSFTQDVRDARAEWRRSSHRVLWNHATMQDNLPEVKFSQLLEDDKALHDWIVTLEQVGVHLITHTPPQNGQLLRLAHRVAFLRKTNYGELFQVKAKLDPSNQGYTPDSLGLHTDLAYYWNPPFVACLHCISQTPTQGGESELADGFHVAEVMRREHPEHFRVLSTVPIDYYDEGSDFYQFYKLTKHPVIGLGADGSIERIVYNNPVRDTFLTVPVEHVQPLYRALSQFDTLLYSPENLVKFKLKPGEMISYQNVRVLHGRTGFEPLESGTREVEGGNLDLDELLSCRRVLAQKLGLHQRLHPG